jgi:drug/metabolite transporter (DMT)-like permease
VGIAVLSLGDSLTPALNLAFERGDAMVLLSAVFYSLHVVRLGSLAPSLDAVDLSRMKSATELALCTISIAVLTALGIREYSAYASTVVTAAAASPAAVLPVIAAVVWNGLAATALTTWAQSRGQRAVGPTTANLIYSSQPLWSAAFAFLFLHETLSTRGWIGSAVLMVAIVYGAIGVNGNAIKTKTENFVIDS